MIEKAVGVYKITNPIGQSYIGKSNDIYNRWRGYRAMKFKSQKILRESFVKYGVSNHLFEIVEICDLNDSVTREKYWVAHFETYNTKHGLNRNKGGGGCVQHTEETKKIIGQHSKGNKHRLGKKHSPERLLQMKQYRPTKETIEKTSSKNRGQKRSVEQRKRMSESKKGIVHSVEHREKIRRTLTGTKHSPETILKRVLANSGEKACMYGKFGKDHPAFGSKRTEEQKQRMRASNKKTWDRKRSEGLAIIPEERKCKIREHHARMKSDPEYYSPEQKAKRRNRILKSWETIRKNKMLNGTN